MELELLGAKCVCLEQLFKFKTLLTSSPKFVFFKLPVKQNSTWASQFLDSEGSDTKFLL